MSITEIERVLSDFWELGFIPSKPRDGEILVAHQMISVVAGVRRGGKSTRVLQYAEELINKGKLPSIKHVIWIDFDNPILAMLKAAELQLIEQAVQRLNPSFEINTPLLFIFDEIHKIEGWENYVIQLSRNPNRQVVVTGSSSKLLKDDIATELRGKSITTTMYPLSFKEFLGFHEISIGSSTRAIADITRCFDQYLKWGAFPALHHIIDAFKPQLLREYFNTMMLRDIIQRYNISKPQQCTKLLGYYFSNMAKPHTLKASYEYIKSAGLPTSRDALRSYTEIAEDSYMLYSIPMFSKSLKEKERNYSKIYPIDWGLAQHTSPVWDGYLSRALETMVFIELKRKGFSVNYYLTRKDRKEIDFVVSKHGQVIALIQVSMDISNLKTFEREIAPLLSAAKYFNPAKIYILQMADSRIIDAEGIQIEVVPVWKWLLNNEL